MQFNNGSCINNSTNSSYTSAYVSTYDSIEASNSDLEKVLDAIKSLEREIQILKRDLKVEDNHAMWYRGYYLVIDQTTNTFSVHNKNMDKLDGNFATLDDCKDRIDQKLL